ncbi:MAG: malto-oligosyltrehalose synthase [Deltaproteobacteria bacterium]|nr:malto-oligosyltrehalose synthase [Deltaproteobacteria bacterium]
MHPEPIATYRLQMRSGFGFEQAAAVVPYLSDLGISHLYTSPYLQAAAGSTHGYDIVDPSRVDEELGGSEAHARLCATLLTAGLGQMIDVVPNHMAIAGKQNPWWWDVIENGPSSRYATYFDVDWKASRRRWPNKVLLPVLGDHYGRILEDSQIRLSRKEGSFVLDYHDHEFPVDPSSLAEILSRAAEACGSEDVAFLGQSHAELPRSTITAPHAVERRHRDKAVLSNLLARLCREKPEIDAAINAEVDRLNRDPVALDSFVDRQNYRLAFWRMASRDLGYRRFFDIKDLAGLRIEDRGVFRATHILPITWVRNGWVHGLRVDHPDGLREPGDYFHRLRAFCPDAWIVAEKILEPGEKLPSDWPIAGTTGYDFLNLAGGLFIDPQGEANLTRFYEDFTGTQTKLDALVRECKRLVLTELLGSELNRLTSLFVDICERHPRHRDFTRRELYEALCETAVYFRVYRTYVSASGNAVNQQDEQYVDEAIEGAMTERPDLDPELFRFLKDLLLLRITGALENELAMRFQQLTGPAMAKGVEDTAFYRYHRLISLNEVGGDPACFGVPLERFHKACTVRQAEHPLGMLASTTHDTKRSEDVRSRLALLSEIPDRWTDAVRRWSSHNERHRRKNVPDRNTEYLFYQTLVGAWPIDVDRITAYMEKAVREAKMHTSWTTQNQSYERNLSDFIRAVLEDEGFRLDLEAFVTDLVAPGRINSLAQTLIKLTAPGVPDIYQGTELWDLSLVDPDNRRPVDFALRRHLLDEVEALPPEEIMTRMDEGLPKLWVIRQTLHLRRSRPKPFGPTGSYRPLYAQGGRADHVVAFIRGGLVLSVTPRLIMGLNGDWSDTKLDLPEGRWHNILTGDEVTGGPVGLQELLSRFPVGLLVQGDG